MTNHARRDCDAPEPHDSPCEKLLDHLTLESRILAELDEIKRTMIETREILQVWQNTKGFVETMKSIGKLILWIVAIGAAFAAFSEVLRHWLVGGK